MTSRTFDGEAYEWWKATESLLTDEQIAAQLTGDPYADLQQTVSLLEQSLLGQELDVEGRQGRVDYLTARLADPTLGPRRRERFEARLESALAILETQQAEFADTRQRLQRAEGELYYFDVAALTLPWIPRDLLGIFVDNWKEFGEQDIALAAVRQDPLYETYFPGIRRADGTLRMTELEYAATRASYENSLVDIGVNPSYFQSQFGDLIAGEVSAQEFDTRVKAMEQRILSQEAEMRETFAAYYGVDLTTEALIAAALDPNVANQILNRQITVAEIGGEAAIQNFQISRETSSSLFAAGFDTNSAQQLFRTAAELLPGLARAAQRQNEGIYGIGSFLGSEALGDTTESARLRRIVQGEQSAFTEQQLVAADESGALTGLRQR